ncbi:RNA polymerase sigma factor [Chitinophaga costaii]|nr:RNA polymerase sigma-70 factor [Chitinophaga costaii]
MKESSGEYSDSQLLVLVQQGDKDAFTLLYNRYWDKLLVYVMRAVQVQSDAEDIVQELFISLWKRRESLDIRSALSTYLFNSARYGAIRYIEKNITRSNYLEFLSKTTPAAPAADQALALKEVSAQMEEVVAGMPERMQQVFRLSREQHLSHREIAAQLGISEETVKKQIYRALQLLRARFGDIPSALLVYMTLYLFF